MGDIGIERREVEFEPVPAGAPVPGQRPAAPVPDTPAPAPDPPPAGPAPATPVEAPAVPVETPA